MRGKTEGRRNSERMRGRKKQMLRWQRKKEKKEKCYYEKKKWLLSKIEERPKE